MQEMSFDDWFGILQEIVFSNTGVQFRDEDSVFMEYGRGDSAEDVAYDIIDEYNGE